MNNFLSESELKKRGWTKTTIVKFLNQPDKLKTNPMYKTAAKTKLYKIERVVEIEESSEFKEWKQKSEKRSIKAKESSHKRIDKQINKILNWINSLEIEIPKLEYEELIDLACQHYNEYKQKGNSLFIPVDCYDNPHFLYRITHNFIRHKLTNYESLLRDMFGEIGKDEGYELLKERLTNSINETYPDLIQFLVSRKE